VSARDLVDPAPSLQRRRLPGISQVNGLGQNRGTTTVEEDREWLLLEAKVLEGEVRIENMPECGYVERSEHVIGRELVSIRQVEDRRPVVAATAALGIQMNRDEQVRADAVRDGRASGQRQECVSGSGSGRRSRHPGLEAQSISLLSGD